MIKLLPIQQNRSDNTLFLNNPDCEPALSMTIDFFNQIGYYPPWVGYFVQVDDQLVGSAAFKGKPKAGRVEIAYGVMPAFQQQGIGTEICRQLVLLALETDPAVTITAQTLPEENYSTRILQKNGFVHIGMAWDDDEGDVWEWEYRGSVS